MENCDYFQPPNKNCTANICDQARIIKIGNFQNGTHSPHSIIQICNIPQHTHFLHIFVVVVVAHDAQIAPQMSHNNKNIKQTIYCND